MRHQILPAATAFVAIAMGFLVHDVYLEYKRNMPWLESSFFVPNFALGENVEVNYARNIYEHVNVVWHVEMRQAGTHKTVCAAGNTTTLSPDEPRVYPFPFGGLWSEKNLKTKTPCSYVPGDYYLEFTYSTPTRKNHVVQSNVFTVNPLP